MSGNINKNVICSYETCDGFLQSLLEKCQNGSWPNFLQHMCQTVFEHRERLIPLYQRKCQKYLEEQVMDGSLPCQKQKGYMNCSVVLCPWLYFFANWVAWITNQKKWYPICPSFMEKSFLFQGQVKGQNLLRSNMICNIQRMH